MPAKTQITSYSCTLGKLEQNGTEYTVYCSTCHMRINHRKEQIQRQKNKSLSFQIYSSKNNLNKLTKLNNAHYVCHNLNHTVVLSHFTTT